MKILVIGGTYFLGKAFVREIAGENEVTVLNRGTRRTALDDIQNVQFLTMDRQQPDREKLQGQFDVVVDFCAYSRGDIAGLAKILGDTIKQYIFISTVDVLKKGTGKVLDEKAPLEDAIREPGNEQEAYISGKIALEQEVAYCSEKYGFSYTIIRPAVLYGPDNYAPRESVFFQWIDKAGQILFPENATGCFQMVYVSDVAQIIATCCGNELAYGKIYNLCGDGVETYETFALKLQEVVPIPFEKVPVTVEQAIEQNLPLPFPLTREESERYSGDLVQELFPSKTGEKETGFAYTKLLVGLRNTYRWHHKQQVFGQVDALFRQKHPKEAEAFLLQELEQAKEEQDDSFCLTLYNELIGYYRQTSEQEKLLQVIEQTVAGVEKNGLQQTLAGATSYLNVANALRSMGRLEQSDAYYKRTQAIYRQAIERKNLEETNLLVAGLYNNMSLLYQEMGNYREAESCLFQALSIVTFMEAGFETAVTYGNLANTFVLAKDYRRAKEYALKSIHLCRARGLKDPHYCAALSALATCYLEEGKVALAKEVFEQAGQIVKETIGENSQYARLQDSIKNCENRLGENNPDALEKGLDLAQRFYQDFGAGMIHDKFPEYENRIAVGLVGEGSECYGFDDGISRDHDFGPDFCLWLTDEDYDKIGQELTKAYEELPAEYLGYKREYGIRAQGRRGVLRISDFFRKHLGTEKPNEIEYRVVPEYELAVCTNGTIFRDDLGEFSRMYHSLQEGYPGEIRFLKLAEDVAGFSQCGQYNYFRFLERGDEMTAHIMLADFEKHTMRLWHHFCGVYTPHDKWLVKSMERLPEGKFILESLERIRCQDVTGSPENLKMTQMDRLGEWIAGKLYEQNVISDVDGYLDHHIEELLFRARLQDSSDEELVDKIVKLEFEAFDKVKNEGGRAYCQNDWPTFRVMRKSQYLTWNRDMLMQYYFDFSREYHRGHNLITEKYGRMMESTAHERYEEIKENFPELTEEQKSIIEQIVALQMTMMEEFAKEHPLVAGNARRLHTYEDTLVNTSYETYLRGEISTYSDRMLQLYGQYVVAAVKEGRNIAAEIIGNTAKLYGFRDVAGLESSVRDGVF